MRERNSHKGHYSVAFIKKFLKEGDDKLMALLLTGEKRNKGLDNG